MSTDGFFIESLIHSISVRVAGDDLSASHPDNGYYKDLRIPATFSVRPCYANHYSKTVFTDNSDNGRHTGNEFRPRPTSVAEFTDNQHLLLYPAGGTHWRTTIEFSDIRRLLLIHDSSFWLNTRLRPAGFSVDHGLLIVNDGGPVVLEKNGEKLA